MPAVYNKAPVSLCVLFLSEQRKSWSGVGWSGVGWGGGPVVREETAAQER